MDVDDDGAFACRYESQGADYEPERAHHRPADMPPCLECQELDDREAAENEN